MQSNFFTLIQGGVGPDVWDKELHISAVDFQDASNQALAKAEELGGQVVSLEQNDYRKPVEEHHKELLNFVRIAQSNTCRHTADVDGSTCPVCVAIRKLIADGIFTG